MKENFIVYIMEFYYYLFKDFGVESGGTLDLLYTEKAMMFMNSLHDNTLNILWICFDNN